MENSTDTIQKEAAIERASVPTPLEVELDSQKAIARIAAIAQTIDGCVKVSIQRTNPKDWVRMLHNQKQADGSYIKVESFYLQASGAQKIRPVWGIYFRDRQISRENYPDGTYAYVVSGTVGSKVLDQLYGEVVIDIEGGRNANDAFFTGKDGNNTVDPMDVRKASLANWEARAITALLGLKNMSAEDLKKNNIDTTQVAGFQFQEGSQGGGKTQLISQAQGKRLFAICKSANVSQDALKQHLFVEYSLTSTADIPRDKYEAICNWAQSGGQNTNNGRQQEAQRQKEALREPGEEG